MGSVFSGIGDLITGSKSVPNTLGIQNNFQAGNPYSQQQLQNDVNQQADIYQNQQNLAQALMNQQNGIGPNPAQTQYLANVQNNIANTQGLIASQRGLNPALAARLGANAATTANQQGSMGAALLQQQNQLAAQQELGGLYGQMQQGNLGAQQLYTQGSLGSQGLNQNTSSQNTQNNTKLIGGLLNGAGGIGAAAAGAAHGGRINGKAQVAGDSPKNDTVHAMLSPGEIVIPRSKAQDPEKAKEFIDHLLKHEKKSKAEYGDVIKARQKRKAE